MKKILYTMMAFAIATFALTSCEDVPAPYDIPTAGGEEPDSTPTEELLGTGTESDPYNVAAALDATSALGSGETTAEKIYIKGVVTSVKECSASYGNATFYLGDSSDATTTFYVYRCLGLDNKNITSDDAVQVGDTIIVYGNVTNYNGTIETVQKDAYIYYSSRLSNGESSSDTPSGDVIAKTCAEASAIALALSESNVATAETYSITGYITNIVGDVSKNQQTFWMADSKDGGKVFEAYYANLPEGVSEFTVGSKVTITGNIMKYNTTPEIKNATVVILEQGSGTESGSDNTSSTTTGNGITIDGTTVTLTNSDATLGSDYATMVVNELALTDKASAVGTYSFSDGTTLTIAQGEGKTGPTYYAATNGFRIYASNTLTFNSASKTIAKIVMECDSYNGTNYVGNETATFTVTGNTAVYNNYFEGNSGGTQLRVQKITVYYASSASAKRAKLRRK